MEKQATIFGRFFAYILDKIFRGIMVFFYGAHPSETIKQKRARQTVVILVIVGIVLFILIRKAIFR